MLFGYKKADEVRRQFYLMLWNVYKFFVEYANLDKFKIQNSNLKMTMQNSKFNKLNILDRWILSRFSWLVDLVEKSLKNFDARSAALEIERFVSDLSTWYIRRSRERVWVNSQDIEDKKAFYQTLYFILVNLSIILSPFIPFISEEMYKNLTGNESVHLESWPIIDKSLYDKKLEEEMQIARKIVEVGHAKRKEMKVKTRFPLRKLSLSIEEKTINLPSSIWQIILQELNVKNIIVNKKYRYPKKEVKVSEEELKKEGELRELLRQIQAERKNLGLKQTDEVTLRIPEKFADFIDVIKIKTRVKKIIFDKRVEVLKN
jgi:isoleucyl-tRNA synthetase